MPARRSTRRHRRQQREPRSPEQAAQSEFPDYERSERKGEQQQRRRLGNGRRGGKETMPLPSFSVCTDDLSEVVDPGSAARTGIGKGHIDRSEYSAAVEKSMYCGLNTVEADDFPDV